MQGIQAEFKQNSSEKARFHLSSSYAMKIDSFRSLKCESPVTTFADVFLAVAKTIASDIPQSLTFFFLSKFISPADVAISLSSGTIVVIELMNKRSEPK